MDMKEESMRAHLINTNVSIDPENLSDEYVHCPADIAYWGAQLAKAQDEHLRLKHAMEVAEEEAKLRHLNAKHDLEILYSQLDQEERQKLGDVKPREPDIKAKVETSPRYVALYKDVLRLGMIELDPTYRRLRSEHDAAVSLETLAKGRCAAMAAKKEMLVSIGATQRLEGDLYLRRKAYEKNEQRQKE